MILKWSIQYPTLPSETTLKSFSYGFEPKEIRVHHDGTVMMCLPVLMAFMDLLLLITTHNQTDTVRRVNTTRVTFVAHKTGIYTYFCPVDSHKENGMVEKLIVE